MTLRKKITIAILVTCVVMEAVTLVVADRFLFDSIDTIESEYARREIERVGNIFDSEVDTVYTSCLDWAMWDDTYYFMEDIDKAYIASNLVDGSFETLRLNLAMYLDTGGNPVYTKAYDLKSQEEMPLPLGLLDNLDEQGFVLHGDDPVEPLRGIVMGGDYPLIVAASPILDSNDQGPSRGTLIFGRILDDTVIEVLAETAGLAVGMHLYDEEPATSFLRDARDAISGEQSAYLAELDEEHYAAAIALRDNNGNPLVILQATLSRGLLAPLRRFGVSLIVSLFVLPLLAAVGALFFMHRWIINRINTFSREIQNIGLKGNLNQRVQVNGNDEITQMAISANSMLDTLKETREAMLSSSEQYRDLFDNASDMIQSVDTEGNFVFTNPAWQETLGYTSEEVASLNMMDVVAPESAEYSMEIFRRLLQGDIVDSVEGSFVTKDGRRVSVIGSASCRFIDNKPAYIRSIFHDVTELDQARDLLKEAYEDERGLRRELQEEITKRIEFTRVLAHELKNSLTSLLAASDMLTEHTSEGPVRQLASNINRTAEHLNNRIREMLDIARMEMGTLTIKSKPTDAGKVLRDMAENIRPLAEKRGQTVLLEFPEELPLVMADADRLSQILLNLLDNASRFTASGGTITIGAEAEASFLKIFVRDNGRGIDSKESSRLFVPYYRIEAERDNMSGLGLGLALCKTLVEMHGGSIDLTSEPGCGTTVFFTMPLYQRDKTEIE